MSAILGPYAPLLPEIVLLLSAIVLLLIGVSGRNAARRGELVSWLTIIAMAVAAALVFMQGDAAAVRLFGSDLVVDDFGRFMKLLVLAGSIGALMLSFNFMKEQNLLESEYAVLILFATAGMMLMISANDLISLYLALELQSLALYCVAAFRRDAVRSSEAGLKYFVLGALSSGILLYGASLIYGFTGTTSFDAIKQAVAPPPGAEGAVNPMATNVGLIIGLVFLLVGLAFKISAVPFHMWTPDVYEGAPTPVTAFFAAAPKVAAMALLIRFVEGAVPGIASQWQQIIWMLAAASMVLGSFAAIGQTNIKRLMAYSSIAHMGFALVGLVAVSEEGTRGVLIYMAVYLAMTLGAFACIVSMRRSDGMVEEIDELAGLAQTNFPMAGALTILLFSLMGIPPLAGFFAKFYVFAAAMKEGFYVLAVIGVLASVVGAVYYLRIIKIMFVDEPKEAFTPMMGKEAVVLSASGLVVVALFLVPVVSIQFVTLAEKAAKSLF
ncbi:MAG: NADH-quinone oxidoreductase subunit NuoN [Pseudomonadota bacterium]